MKPRRSFAMGTFFFVHRIRRNFYSLYHIRSRQETRFRLSVHGHVYSIGIGWMFRRKKPPLHQLDAFPSFTKARENAKKRTEERIKAKKDNEKKIIMSKLISLKEAISKYVKRWRYGLCGGIYTPHSLCGRSRDHPPGQKRDLILARATPDLIYDQMVAAGCAKKVIFSYMGNPGVGSLRIVRCGH